MRACELSLGAIESVTGSRPSTITGILSSVENLAERKFLPLPKKPTGHSTTILFAMRGKGCLQTPYRNAPSVATE
jgi:hypothetical protein